MVVVGLDAAFPVSFFNVSSARNCRISACLFSCSLGCSVMCRVLMDRAIAIEVKLSGMVRAELSRVSEEASPLVAGLAVGVLGVVVVVVVSLPMKYW